MLVQAIRFFQFLCLACSVYVKAGHGGVLYGARIDAYGVPQLTILIGRGRAAWQVTQFAAEFWLDVK